MAASVINIRIILPLEGINTVIKHRSIVIKHEKLWSSPLAAISIGRLTGRPRVANLTGGAVVDSALIVGSYTMSQHCSMHHIIYHTVLNILVQKLHHHHFELEHLPDPRREVSTDWLLWEASSPLMNTLAGSENL